MGVDRRAPRAEAAPEIRVLASTAPGAWWCEAELFAGMPAGGRWLLPSRLRRPINHPDRRSTQNMTSPQAAFPLPPSARRTRSRRESGGSGSSSGCSRSRTSSFSSSSGSASCSRPSLRALRSSPPATARQAVLRLRRRRPAAGRGQSASTATALSARTSTRPSPLPRTRSTRRGSRSTIPSASRAGSSSSSGGCSRSRTT